MQYNREAILSFLESPPKTLSARGRVWAYDTIFKYLRDHPGDAEVRRALLKHALRTPVTVEAGTAMLGTALRHNPDARDRLIARALRHPNRKVYEWGVERLREVPREEMNPELVSIVAHRVEDYPKPFVKQFMNEILDPDDYRAFAQFAGNETDHLVRSPDAVESLWGAMQRLERLWGASVLIPLVGRILRDIAFSSPSTQLNAAPLVRRAAQRYWNADGRDLLRAILDADERVWKRVPVTPLKFWKFATAGVAFEDPEAAFTHIVDDVLRDENRYTRLLVTGRSDTTMFDFSRVFSLTLGLASPASLERMRRVLYDVARQLPEWIANDSEMILHLLHPDHFEPWGGVGSKYASMYALRPMVLAAHRVTEEQPIADIWMRDRPVYAAMTVLPTLVLESADEIGDKHDLLKFLHEKQSTFEYYKQIDKMRNASKSFLNTVSAWDDTDAARWNAQARATAELDDLLESFAPMVGALWRLALMGLPGAPSEDETTQLVLNKLFSEPEDLGELEKKIGAIAEFFKQTGRNNPPLLTALRARFENAVHEAFLHALQTEPWGQRHETLSRLIGVLRGYTDDSVFAPHLLMPDALLTAPAPHVNRKFASLKRSQQWKAENELRKVLCRQ